MSIKKLKIVADELSAAQQRVQDFARTEGKAAIGAAFQKFFDLAPRVTKIVWTQYTPYFNDGETCEFGVNEPEVWVDSDKESDRYVDPMERWATVCGWYTPDRVVEINERLCDRYGSRPAVDAFWDVWCNLPSELLEAVFGDHVRITVTRDAVEVDGYDHD